jgi:hypothetical protein
VLAVARHGTAAIALELDAGLALRDADRLHVAAAAAALDFAMEPVEPLQFEGDHPVAPGVVLAAGKRAGIELAPDVVVSEFHCR